MSPKRSRFQDIYDVCFLSKLNTQSSQRPLADVLSEEGDQENQPHQGAAVDWRSKPAEWRRRRGIHWLSLALKITTSLSIWNMISWASNSKKYSINFRSIADQPPQTTLRTTLKPGGYPHLPNFPDNPSNFLPR